MEFYLFWFTILVSVFIILIAYLKDRIDLSAVLASGFVGITIIVALRDSWQWIYLILGFFIAGNLISRYRESVKTQYHVEQERRTFRNVFGNGAASTIFAIVYWFTHKELFLVGIVGAMATATADTFATEVGQAHERKPRLITTLKKVDVGTSGAVSLYGLSAALIGSSIISTIPLLFSQNMTIFVIGTISGFIGCNIDSFFGATIEKGMLNTHMVNFIATFLGGIIAMSLFYLCVS